MKPWIKDLSPAELRKQLNIHVNKLWQANEKIRRLEEYIAQLEKSPVPSRPTLSQYGREPWRL